MPIQTIRAPETIRRAGDGNPATPAIGPGRPGCPLKQQKNATNSGQSRSEKQPCAPAECGPLMWDLQSLFLKHADDIARSLRRRGINGETALDLTQDTFVRVIASPPAPDATRDNPVGYLFRVARNLGTDHLRRNRLLVHADIAADAFAAIADTSPSPEIIVYDRQRLALTHAALAELPDRTRKAFKLYRMDDMTIAAVAVELGLSISRTWMLIRNAHEHIDARLTER